MELAEELDISFIHNGRQLYSLLQIKASLSGLQFHNAMHFTKGSNRTASMLG